MKRRFRLIDVPIERKTVLLRVDFNVPLQKKGKKWVVADNTKIKAALKTINYLLKKDCRIIVFSHLGRPHGKKVKELSLIPVEKELFKLLKIKKHKRVVLLENLRFHPGEDSNDKRFAKNLVGLGEIYVNDAFGVSHRTIASTVAITRYIPSCSGFLLDKEIDCLSMALKPKRPSVWIIGGAKLDKMDLFNHALKKADKILLGGAMAFSFMKANGYFVGMSKIDTKSVRIAKKILKKGKKKIILPVDVVVANDFKKTAKKKTVSIDDIPNDWIGLDVGKKTVALYKRYVRMARTIVWNGPLGVFEFPKFSSGTREIAKALAQSNAITLVGGGETAGAVKKFKVQSKLTHVSTGGGASLALLSGKKLPALIALDKSYKKFKKKL